MISWGRLKWFLDQMSPAQLQEPATAFSPFYGRVHLIDGIDNLQNIDPKALTNEVVLAMNPNAKC